MTAITIPTTRIPAHHGTRVRSAHRTVAPAVRPRTVAAARPRVTAVQGRPDRVASPSRARVSSRPDAAVFWRRRVAALVLGVGLGAVGSEAASAVVSGVSRVSAPASIHYVVRPGDTLWSIARTVAPHEDPRAVVDLLQEAHGSSMIRPGDVIEWAG